MTAMGKDDDKQGSYTELAGGTGSTNDAEIPVTDILKKGKLIVNGLHDDKGAEIKKSHSTVQLRRTIYSAAALDFDILAYSFFNIFSSGGDSHLVH